MVDYLMITAIWDSYAHTHIFTLLRLVQSHCLWGVRKEAVGRGGLSSTTLSLCFVLLQAVTIKFLASLMLARKALVWTSFWTL